MAQSYPPTQQEQKQKQEPKVYARMSREVYERFEKQFPPIMTPKSDIESAYNLGIQAVLSALRKDIVIS